MRDYRCYYCNSQLITSGSNMPDEIPFYVSEYCHIVNHMICANPTCECEHIEEVDITDKLIYFGPLKNIERL